MISTRKLAVLENSTIHAKSSTGHFHFNISRGLYWKIVPFLHRRSRCVRIDPEPSVDMKKSRVELVCSLGVFGWKFLKFL